MESIIAEGQEVLWGMFPKSKNLAEEIASFQVSNVQEMPELQQEQERGPGASQTIDDYVLRANRKKCVLAPKTSAAELLKLHTAGYDVLPPTLVGTINTLHPTSVPAKGIFSWARHMQRYCQESQEDERFANYLFLRNFYVKTKPWESFRAQYDMSKQCKF